MYELENFTRPYLMDVANFNYFVIGENPLTIEDWENICSNNENVFCKILLDGLMDTLGYIACEIKEDFSKLNFSDKKINSKVGFFYHCSIEHFEKEDTFKTLLLGAIKELAERGIENFYFFTKEPLQDFAKLNLFEKKVNNLFLYSNF